MAIDFVRCPIRKAALPEVGNSKSRFYAFSEALARGADSCEVDFQDDEPLLTGSVNYNIDFEVDNTLIS